MINFDSLTLKLFAQEAKEFLIGAKLQKVQQPNRNELIFSIRNKGESRKLYINFNPNFYHVCFMSPENEKRRNITIPKAAPMFCMLLRKYIQNSKITKIEVPKGERILEIYFEYFDELNEKTELCLAIELMGKYSNVILYNYDTNVIIGCAHNVSSEKSRERELYGMLPYIYPPKQKKKDLLKVTFDSFLKTVANQTSLTQTISSNYHYLTIPLIQEFLNRTNDPSNIYNYLKDFLSKKEYTPYLANDYSKYFLFEFEDAHKMDSINEIIDEYYSHHQNKFLMQNLKTKILRHIQSQLKKLYALKTKQTIQIEKLDKAITYKNKADIIMTNLYQIKQGMKIASLYDFEGNNIEIELDENMTPSENANRYYALYKKTKSAHEHAKTMIEETNSQILYFEEQKFYAENTDIIEDLEDIFDDLFEDKPNKTDKTFKIDYIEYQNAKIYIGKNKKQNDYILSKIASSEDIWFHPLNFAGAHILVKLQNSKENLSDEILLKAAELTKEYSSQKNNSKTSIIYTKRKYVKKANNKLAFVTYKNETEIVI